MPSSLVQPRGALTPTSQYREPYPTIEGYGLKARVTPSSAAEPQSFEFQKEAIPCRPDEFVGPPLFHKHGMVWLVSAGIIELRYLSAVAHMPIPNLTGLVSKCA